MGKHASIYKTARWQRLRKVKLAMQPLCEYCLQIGRYTPATEVDHWLAISDGGAPYDLGNLRSSCQRCHALKTRNSERVIGCGKDGMPLDPRHAWAQVGR